jgi:hypothetical protein
MLRRGGCRVEGATWISGLSCVPVVHDGAKYSIFNLTNVNNQTHKPKSLKCYISIGGKQILYLLQKCSLSVTVFFIIETYLQAINYYIIV